MRYQKSRLFRATASLVLASFGWMTGGGQAWAEVRAAEAAPASALARLAGDPRLPLSPAARRPAPPLPRGAGGRRREPGEPLPSAPGGAPPPAGRKSAPPAYSVPMPPPGSEPSELIQEIVAELERLTAKAGAAATAEAAGAA